MTVFHAMYHVLVIYHYMPHNSCSLQLAASWAVCKPFVEVQFSPICYPSTACYTVCYLLPCPIQFIICCYTPYSLLVVAACHTVCYLLLHTTYSLLTCCRTPCSFLYLLPHAVQFATGCHMPYGLLFVAARCTVFYICYCMPYNLLFVAACRTVCYFLLHAVCCHMPYSCYLMPHAAVSI